MKILQLKSNKKLSVYIQTNLSTLISDFIFSSWTFSFLLSPALRSDISAINNSFWTITLKKIVLITYQWFLTAWHPLVPPLPYTPHALIYMRDKVLNYSTTFIKLPHTTTLWAYICHYFILPKYTGSYLLFHTDSGSLSTSGRKGKWDAVWADHITYKHRSKRVAAARPNTQCWRITRHITGCPYRWRAVLSRRAVGVSLLCRWRRAITLLREAWGTWW